MKEFREHKCLKDRHPIFKAALTGDTDYLTQYLAEGGEVYVDSPSNPPLAVLATQKGHTDFIRLLIEGGFDVNEPFISNDQYILHYAIPRVEDLEFFRVLIKAGVDANHEDRTGLKPLRAAFSNGPVALVELLIAAGARLEDPLALWRAAAGSGQIELLEFLLEKFGSNGVGMSGTDQRTPIFIAALRGKLEAVKWLISKGADPNAVDRNGDTPYEASRKYGSSEEVTKYLEQLS